jgi:hypothetical protein
LCRKQRLTRLLPALFKRGGCIFTIFLQYSVSILWFIARFGREPYKIHGQIQNVMYIPIDISPTARQAGKYQRDAGASVMGRSTYLCVVAAALACRVLSAQHSHAQASQSGSPMQLQVVVDGSKTPDQIPDNLAYHHFFCGSFCASISVRSRAGAAKCSALAA